MATQHGAPEEACSASGSSSGSSRGSGGGGIGGIGGARIDELPDALMGHIFAHTEYPCRPSIVLNNPSLVLDTATVEPLAAEAPNLRILGIGGTAAAAFKLSKQLSSLPSIAQVSRRWHRVLYETPSIWRSFNVSVPESMCDDDSSLDVEEQEAWLQAKLRQLRRVSPAVESLIVEHTAGADVMSEVLQALSASQLTRIAASEYQQPFTAAAMRALAGLTLLGDLSLGQSDRDLPANSGWALGHLTALTTLLLSAEQFPDGFGKALAGLSHLRVLNLESGEPLPDMQPLTALSRLQELALQEQNASIGLLVIPAALQPERTHVVYSSPILKVGPSLFVATANRRWCIAALYKTGGHVQLQLSGMPPADFSSVTSFEAQACTAAGPGGSMAAALGTALQQMSELRTVRISSCDLSSGVPEALRQLAGVTSLTLTSDHLTNLPALACITGLRMLCLDRNKLTQLPSLGSAPSLTYLGLGDNTSLELDPASAERLAAEAPNLRSLEIGSEVAAGVMLAKKLPSLDAW
ncbi:leucine rich repeat [Chlorella sorokiniana]|uniref:Leucine rich repeat n=1 Tax=Chlorella sorokiniana TaxID=3076 RepID=A0A2P6TMU1_CHLSO|nr:leucine rich repeat [Chlorella sorokiniana]|eukprot:PRW45642.1 leucine rich repeat [Chlorella sorokiniana]